MIERTRNVVRQAGDTRSQAAQAANDEIDHHARLRCGIQHFDDFRLNERVELRDDVAVAACS